MTTPSAPGADPLASSLDAVDELADRPLTEHVVVLEQAYAALAQTLGEAR